MGKGQPAVAQHLARLLSEVGAYDREGHEPVFSLTIQQDNCLTHTQSATLAAANESRWASSSSLLSRSSSSSSWSMGSSSRSLGRDCEEEAAVVAAEVHGNNNRRKQDQAPADRRSLLLQTRGRTSRRLIPSSSSTEQQQRHHSFHAKNTTEDNLLSLMAVAKRGAMQASELSKKDVAPILRRRRGPARTATPRFLASAGST